MCVFSAYGIREKSVVWAGHKDTMQVYFSANAYTLLVHQTMSFVS